MDRGAKLIAHSIAALLDAAQHIARCGGLEHAGADYLLDCSRRVYAEIEEFELAEQAQPAADPPLSDAEMDLVIDVVMKECPSCAHAPSAHSERGCGLCGCAVTASQLTVPRRTDADPT